MTRTSNSRTNVSKLQLNKNIFLAGTALPCFVGYHDLISIIYANIQNQLRNFACLCPQSIYTKFHQHEI